MHGEEKALSNSNALETVNGFLFTTSSPCELCAKKAKDYRISKVYYIEPYPGISQSHVFNSGDPKTRAVYELFVGAIGLAYTKLFNPLMSYKDELQLRGFPDDFRIEIKKNKNKKELSAFVFEQSTYNSGLQMNIQSDDGFVLSEPLQAEE